jgi:hypothetical protein
LAAHDSGVSPKPPLDSEVVAIAHYHARNEMRENSTHRTMAASARG